MISKTAEGSVHCINCNMLFRQLLYRMVVVDGSEKRRLVMSDLLNTAECPSCHNTFRPPAPLLYVDELKGFAIWYDPCSEGQRVFSHQSLSLDSEEQQFISSAKRIKDWNQFKDVIHQFERRTLVYRPDISSGYTGQNLLQRIVNLFARNS